MSWETDGVRSTWVREDLAMVMPDVAGVWRRRGAWPLFAVLGLDGKVTFVGDEPCQAKRLLNDRQCLQLALERTPIILDGVARDWDTVSGAAALLDAGGDVPDEAGVDRAPLDIASVQVALGRRHLFLRLGLYGKPQLPSEAAYRLTLEGADDVRMYTIRQGRELQRGDDVTGIDNRCRRC